MLGFSIAGVRIGRYGIDRLPRILGAEIAVIKTRERPVAYLV